MVAATQKIPATKRPTTTAAIRRGLAAVWVHSSGSIPSVSGHETEPGSNMTTTAVTTNASSEQSLSTERR